MPQLTEFPRPTDGGQASKALIKLARSKELATFADLKARLSESKLWDRANPLPVLRFIGVQGAYAGPTPFLKSLGATLEDEPAFDVIAERLWAVNPLLFSVIVGALGERPAMRDELYKVLASSVFKGQVPSRPELEAWLSLAVEIQILKNVGIAVTLTDRGKAFAERAAELVVEDFLETDKPDPDPIVPSAAEAAAAAAAPAAAAPPPAPEKPTGLPRWLSGAEPLASPRKRGPVVPLARFARGDVFPEEVGEDTGKRIAAWWGEVGRPSTAPKPEDFGFDPEAWVENADELLYRIAVAAALLFRAGGDAAMFKALDTSGILAELYQGTMPTELPDGVDPRTLMIASLVARRCSESPGLAGELDQKKSAEEVFGALEAALGRGLFKIELHWIIGTLAQLGLVRHEDLGDFTALPYRLVRDTLFRLGYLTSPYATDAPALIAAARAARKAAGGAEHPEEVIAAFAIAAGCAYDCTHRKACEYACRERLE